MEPQTLIENNVSILRRYANRQHDLYEPAPTSPYLKATLMLLENPYIAPHILSVIRGYSSHQPEFSPNVQSDMPCPSDDGTKEETVKEGDDDYVYIIPRTYLQNWLTWVSHQSVPDQEQDRLSVAVSMATVFYDIDISVLKPMGTVSSTTQLDSTRNNSSVNGSPTKQVKTKGSKKKKKKKKHPPSQSPNEENHTTEGPLIQTEQSLGVNESARYPEPGPVDSSCLSVQGHPPFRLRPNVTLQYGAPTISISSPHVSNEDPTHLDLDCAVAVPESFYEYIQTVHGVICQDRTTIALSSSSIRSKDTSIVSHFQRLSYSKVQDSMDVGVENELEHRIRRLDLNTDKELVLNEPWNNNNMKQPVEFRRKVVTIFSKEGPSLREDVETEVELFPFEFYYRMVHKSLSDDDMEDLMKKSTDTYNWHENNESQGAHGCVFVSRTSTIQTALGAILHCIVPDGNTDYIRLWYDRRKSTYRQTNRKMGATFIGDGFELVDPADISSHRTEDTIYTNVPVDEWVKLRIGSPLEKYIEVHLLVEIRTSPESPWPRKRLELSNRIQVGDFVDAQDLKGSWYEAVVRKVSEKSVRVHFCGWSSKWDRTIRRYVGDEIIPMCCKVTNPPVPLWTKTSRWRDMVCVGDLVEVRDSTSSVERPRWFRGVVKRIGDDDDSVQPTIGGADLEALDVDDNGLRVPLLLLHRKRQVLVKVEKESTFETTIQHEVSTDFDSSNVPSASPPHLRWVNLYGEEICRWNTHLCPKPTEDSNHDKGNTMVEKFPSKAPALGKSFAYESLIGTPVAKGSVGLLNLGNTCYMNAILQCLNQIEILTSYFLKEEHLKDLNETNPLGTGGELALAYGSLIHKIWGGKYSQMSPEDLKLSFAKFAPQFNNTYQHDSHEFCSFLLDGLHEDMNRIKDKPYIEDIEGLGRDCDAAAVTSWRNYLKRHDSLLVDHCHGMQKSHLTCPQCGKESIKFDVYSSLSLTLDSTRHQNTLLDCLDKFTQGEELDEANGWYCSQCQKHVCARKKIQLWTTPDILILHLKRFTFKANGSKKHGLVRSKIQDVINFPIDRLDLHKYVYGPKDELAPPIYKLLGVAEHSGLTTNSGHYTATVRNMTNGVWYHCNDTHVTVTNAEAAISKSAYLLFYERSYGTSRWAGMEKLMERMDKPLIDNEGFQMVSTKKKKKKAI